MQIPMEDWLRGCVYHDGRNGEVTLPTDKVLEIANYIQLSRTSLTDGCIKADTPQTDECEGCKHYVYQLGCTHHATCEYEPKEPQTETQTETQNSNLTFEKTDCEITECDYHKYCKERGQTDCGWK